MANVAECSERSIKAIRSNLHHFGTTKAPPNGGGRSRSISYQNLVRAPVFSKSSPVLISNAHIQSKKVDLAANVLTQRKR
jgi:hypothetical protein